MKIKAAFVLVFTSFFVVNAEAVNATANSQSNLKNAPKPRFCAIVHQLEGRAQILNSSRTQTIDPLPTTEIPCGAWVSVDSGVIKLRHRDGSKVHIGPQSFISIQETDHWSLFRGKIYVDQMDGALETRVVTANARARILRGSAAVIFDTNELNSQLVVFENEATLENRYEEQKRITVKQGEASDLNFALLRVLPSAPHAMAVVGVRALLDDLQIDGLDQKRAVQNALIRSERKMAVIESSDRLLGNTPDEIMSYGKAASSMNKNPVKKVHRKTASQEKHYYRHAPTKTDSQLIEHYMSKISGGDGDQERILFPQHFQGKRQNASVEVRVPKHRVKSKQSEELEKQRLIDELQQLDR